MTKQPFADPVDKPAQVVEESSFDWQTYARTIWRRRYAFIGVFVATFSLAAAYTFLSNPVYEGEMLLLLEDRNSQPKVLADEASPMSYFASNSADINTQIEVLLRRPLIEKALRVLRPKFPELLDQDAEDITKRLEIIREERTQVAVVSFEDTDPQVVKAILDELSRTYIDYSLEIQKSKLDGAIAFIENELPPVRKEVERAEEQLRTFRRQYSILDPQVQGTELAATLNTLNRDYEQSKAELEASKEHYWALSERLGISPGQALASATLSKDGPYQENLTQLQKVETQLALEQARFRDDYPAVQSLKSKRDRLRQVLASQAQQILGDRTVPAIVSGGASLQDSIADSVNNTGSPKGITDRLGDLQVNLAAELIKAENAYRVQTARVAGLENVKNRMIGQFKVVPSLAKRYQELVRDSNLASNSLNRLLERLQELRIQAAQELSPWRVIEPAAIPEKPIWPKPLLTLGGGALLGLVFGLGIASLLESVDDRVKSISQAKELLNLPLLGAIPFTEEEDLQASSQPQFSKERQKPDLPKSSLEKSMLREAFRSLLTNLRFLSSDRKLKVFVVSSSMPGEGKSTVATNLAKVVGGLNRKALLVDADLRRPTVSNKLELSNGPGLSTVLAGEMHWSNCVNQIDENVHVLTSGPLPPDPVALLDSLRMKELVKQWGERYDLVIIDSPPMIGLADATILTKCADGLVFVIGLEVARRGGVLSALERLRSASLVPVGFVANGVRKEAEGRSYYTQHYYHYYGQPTPDKNQTGTRQRKK
ncbi:GumC family protein [Gloeobacter violaceus]|uniref:non-specific protein-tyrosine kinase n=1 Tax=Gloeobacter violaceus (strain ATCC 29082 / PCC 7421) TaxID=251221 RepID=Q7NEU3_GLOVI|nr:polysaccharide biosynthesis tyrosine autokinase [Gloeobacter violaceus]BAC91726.1 glr3785 [Gloeobacter violaceus PCC 7421]